MTARGPGSPTERDLRALLDADKVNNRQMGLMQFVEAHPLPAAQPQGEPVAWIIQWASTIPGMRGHREVVLIEPSLNPRAATVTPLYAEQPAPVAVVLPTPSPDPQVEARAKEIYDG